MYSIYIIKTVIFFLIIYDENKPRKQVKPGLIILKDKGKVFFI